MQERTSNCLGNFVTRSCRARGRSRAGATVRLDQLPRIWISQINRSQGPIPDEVGNCPAVELTFMPISDCVISSGKPSANVSTRSRQRRSARRLYACWRVTNDTSIISGFQARRIDLPLRCRAKLLAIGYSFLVCQSQSPSTTGGRKHTAGILAALFTPTS